MDDFEIGDTVSPRFGSKLSPYWLGDVVKINPVRITVHWHTLIFNNTRIDVTSQIIPRNLRFVARKAGPW